MYSTGKTLNFVNFYSTWQAVGMVRDGMSYIKIAERVNVSHSVIVRLKQRVNQTGSVKERKKDKKASENDSKRR
jgi:transposase